MKSGSGEAFSKSTIINTTLKKLKLRFNLIKFFYINSIEKNIIRNRNIRNGSEIPSHKEEIKRMKHENKAKKDITLQIE